jgi:hypothetical protein
MNAGFMNSGEEFFVGNELLGYQVEPPIDGLDAEG